MQSQPRARTERSTPRPRAHRDSTAARGRIGNPRCIASAWSAPEGDLQRPAKPRSAGRGSLDEVADDPPDVCSQARQHVMAGEHADRAQNVAVVAGGDDRGDDDRRAKTEAATAVTRRAIRPWELPVFQSASATAGAMNSPWASSGLRRQRAPRPATAARTSSHHRSHRRNPTATSKCEASRHQHRQVQPVRAPPPQRAAQAAAALTIAKIIAVSAASSRTIARLDRPVRRTSVRKPPSLRARCTRPMTRARRAPAAVDHVHFNIAERHRVPFGPYMRAGPSVAAW